MWIWRFLEREVIPTISRYPDTVRFVTTADVNTQRDEHAQKCSEETPPLSQLVGLARSSL